MKFLLIAKSKTSSQNIESTPESVNKAKEWINSRKREGIIDSVYQIVPHGAVAIGNYDSTEKLMTDIVSYPFYANFKFKVHPLVDTDFIFDFIMKNFE